jgi:hypothetical protein
MISWRAVPTAARAIFRKAYRLATFQNLLVSRGEEKNRLAKCDRCEHKVPRQNGLDQCGVCSCILVLKVKFVDERCPLDDPRW